MKKKELSFRHRLICALPYSLIHFLINYGCFESFIHNACNKAAKGNDTDFLIKLENNKVSPTMIISCAFIWMATSEGDIFWFRRSEWFRDYYEKISEH